MEGLEIVSKEEQQLLNLSLSLVSHACDDHNTRRKRNNDHDSSTSRGSSDGGDHYDHQGELCRLFQLREEMLTRLEKTRSSLLQVVDQGDRSKGPYLIHLLLKSAASVEEYNFGSAMADLAKIYQTASFTGDSAQRVAAYFADGLTARFLKDKSPLYDMIMKDPTPSEEFLGFTHLYKVSPCYQFSHFTANQAILEAFERELEGRSNWRLHVVDFELAYGFQWPSLIQSLSEKATSTNTISLRITGFARSLEELVETEARLVSFAKGSPNVVFEFQGLLRGSKPIHNLVERREDETLAVNLVSCLHTSRSDALKISDTLESVHSLNPSITVLVQRGSRENRRTPTSLGGFMDALHYYAAMFDSLDDCLPRDSLERLCIERNYLGKEIRNAIVNCFQDDHQHHQLMMNSRMHEGLEHGWKKMMESNGYCGIELSSRTMMQAKLLLRMRSNLQPQVEGELYCGGGFRVHEEDNGKAISIGWQDRVLMTASAWLCV